MTTADTSVLIQNTHLITPDGLIDRGWILCTNGRIEAIGEGVPPRPQDGTVIDAGGRFTMPGMIDVHVHGSASHDTMDASTDSLQGMADFFAMHGVTGFLATTWTDSRGRIRAALDAIRDYTEDRHHTGAALLGAHVEGPYINPKRAGAQATTHIRRADPDEAREFLGTGVIRLLSLAPEFEENHWLIEACVEQDITVSAAHTAASYGEMQIAINQGLRHSTHTFNAMTGLHHREPGTVGAVLTSPAITCELIADNIHVHPAVMNLAWRAKGRDGIVLVTDAIRAAGMPDGEFAIDDRVVTLRDNQVRLPDGSLAGSVLTMDRALKNFMIATGTTLAEAWTTVSLNPARVIHMSHRKGSLETGKDADIVVIDEECHISLTIAGGHIVFREGI